MAGGLPRKAGAMAGALVLALIAAACSSALESPAQDAFARLADAVPWPVSGEVDTSASCGTVVDTEMCGPFVFDVLATDDVVLAGLPEVVRDIGFTNKLRTEGCRDCPQEPTVIGEDADGRELAITVYPLDGGKSMLDAYVSVPGT